MVLLLVKPQEYKKYFQSVNWLKEFMIYIQVLFIQN